MKNKIYGVASALVALAMFASGAGIASAQTATSTHNHYGNGYNGNSTHNNNNNHNGNNNGNGNNNNHNGNNGYNNGYNGNHGGTSWYRNSSNLYFYYGGRQYSGAEYYYTGIAYNVTPSSFTIYIAGRPYLVYYATGYAGPGSLIRSGETVRVDGVYQGGVIYAISVQAI